ncbi:small multidrug resistance pump [Polaromonas sp. CG_9.5]|uniref:SMR family transporter n=1 Tax=Polaromonas sp. CG_9.5 TaxID=3071705 RepID=UPI002E0B4F2B|nr:small multidrug resistance pump [Polaromonas sp. CG_9.5]
MNAYPALGIAIVAEVIATTALKASDSFTQLWPSLLAVAGYAIAFYFLTLTLRTVPTGIAYAIWSGLGIVLITIASFLIYRQTIDLPGLLGMALIVAGVVVLNVFSKSAAH